MLNAHESTLSLHAHQTGTKVWECSENEPQKRMHADDEYFFFLAVEILQLNFSKWH